MSKTVVLMDATEDALGQIEKNLQIALGESIVTLQSEVRVRTPVVTGKLAGSHEIHFSPKEAELSNNVEYMPRVEYGFIGQDVLGRTFHQEPKAPFRKGSEAAKPKIEQIFKDRLGKDIKVTYREKTL